MKKYDELDQERIERIIKILPRTKNEIEQRIHAKADSYLNDLEKREYIIQNQGKYYRTAKGRSVVDNQSKTIWPLLVITITLAFLGKIFEMNETFYFITLTALVVWLVYSVQKHLKNERIKREL